MRPLQTCALALMLTCPNGFAAAQPSDPARLTVTVLDPSGARVSQASMTTLERNGSVAPTPRTYIGPSGLIVADDLAPGVYTVRIDAAGFAPVIVRQIPVSGDVRRTVRLGLERLAETVVVQSDGRRAALDPRGFSTVLTREQIDALPDDPVDRAAVLRDLAPPGAVIRVDGFTGGLMPPKSQILSIRLPRLDSYAAQDHGGLHALSFIEIVTTPGGGRVRGSTDVTWRHHALNARNPLTHAPATERAGSAGVALDGPLIPDRMSFALAVRGGLLHSSTAIRAELPDGRSLAEALIRPQRWLTIGGRLVASAWAGHIVRVSLSSEHRLADGVGAGGVNLPERGYRSTSSDVRVRAVSGGAIGRRAFLELRTELRWIGQKAVPAVEQPTIRVLDAFTAGGAQLSGGQRSSDVLAALDLEHAAGVHALRTGVLVERGREVYARHVNYLGTYTFTSLDAYREGRPATYTRRIGRPVSELTHLQFAAYAQDDVRLLRSLLVGFGVRYERQAPPGGPGRLLPRGSLAWSPSRSGGTTVRAGAGLFSEWIAPEIHHQSRLLDGSRQFDMLIHGPRFPTPDETGSIVLRERFGLSPTLRLPRVAAASIGLEQQLGASVRVHAGYSRRVAAQLLRGLDLNASVEGERPDPASGVIVEATSDAGMRAHTVTMQASTLGVGRRTTVTAAYVFSHVRSNTTGAFAIPSSGQLDREWGATMPTHMFTAAATVRTLEALTVSLLPRWRSGLPYSVTTGRDDNQDGLFTERPVGVPRQSLRTPAQFELGARVALTIGLAGEASDARASGAVPSHQLEVFASVQNLTNRPNYTAMGSVVGSPLFGRPLAALDSRQVEIGVRFGF